MLTSLTNDMSNDKVSVLDLNLIRKFIKWNGEQLPYCDICYVEFSSPQNACAHFNSTAKKSMHKKKSKLAKSFNCINDGATVINKQLAMSQLLCLTCYCQMNSLDQYNKHMVSLKHCHKLLSQKRILEVKRLYQEVLSNTNQLGEENRHFTNNINKINKCNTGKQVSMNSNDGSISHRSLSKPRSKTKRTTKPAKHKPINDLNGKLALVDIDSSIVSTGPKISTSISSDGNLKDFKLTPTDDKVLMTSDNFERKPMNEDARFNCLRRIDYLSDSDIPTSLNGDKNDICEQCDPIMDDFIDREFINALLSFNISNLQI